MKFDEHTLIVVCNNLIVLASIAGLIIMAKWLIDSGQDGFMLKSIIAILAGTGGLAIEVPGFLKYEKK